MAELKGTSKEIARMKRVLNCVCTWCPALADTSFASSLIEPFVSLFSNDDIGCVEVVVSVLTHWCQHYLSWWPQPPLGLLNSAINVLRSYKPKL